MVKLRVKVGGSYTDLAIANCNDELHPIEFDAPEFKGRAVVRIKDFVGVTNDGSEPIHNGDYFKGRNRRFSFQVEGRFKREWNGQQIYFGTDFDRPVELPDGFELMLKVCRYIDPVVRASLTKEEKPWVLSPLVSSINTMSAWRPEDVVKLPSPPLTPRASMDLTRSASMAENVSGAVSSAWGFLGKFKRGNRQSVITSSPDNSGHNSRSGSTEHLDKIQPSPARSEPQNIATPVPSEPASLASSATSTEWDAATKKKEEEAAAAIVEEGEMPLGQWRQHLDEDTTFFTGKPSMNTAQRRKHFQSEQHRKDFVFNKDLVYGFEFFSPHMDFNTFDIRLGLSMNVRKYLNNQPVRYTCRTLEGNTVFWAVEFELIE
ncbi:hypothetical protein BGX34_009290 [Mortierella sp. NVP85]|nr:hypothetical protein BGX34_009290 [Mortierella sp. NVP85]